MKTLKYRGIDITIVPCPETNIPVITDDELKAKLPESVYLEWLHWSHGNTCVASGSYVHDVSNFLAGFPNLD